jgi:hypothetical protein
MFLFKKFRLLLEKKTSNEETKKYGLFPENLVLQTRPDNERQKYIFVVLTVYFWEQNYKLVFKIGFYYNFEFIVYVGFLKILSPNKLFYLKKKRDSSYFV